MHQHRPNVLSQHQSVFNCRDVFSENLLTVCMLSFSTCTKCFQLIQKKHTSTYIPTNVQKHPSTHTHTHTQSTFTPLPQQIHANIHHHHLTLNICKYAHIHSHTHTHSTCKQPPLPHNMCKYTPPPHTHTHTHTRTHTTCCMMRSDTLLSTLPAAWAWVSFSSR